MNDNLMQTAASAIRPMPASAVRQIVAGQVIFDMASAVKELVDNALDAGSSTINIRLFNQGLDMIEVSDDGTGIPVDSRVLLATPHATSKLQQFEDLYSTQHTTLGFRGEALFALCTLCPELLVLTRTEDEPLAQKLTYNNQGLLMPHLTQFAPRKRGTTVAAIRLFETFPVRRVDLQRRLPAQKARLLRLLQHYAVMAVGVELSYRIYDTNKRETTLLHTPSRTKELKETIVAVLGSNVYQQLQEITIDLSEWVKQAMVETTLSADTDIDHGGEIQAPSNGSNPAEKWRIQGYISNPHRTATGRSSSAKTEQYFGINGRPVDLPGVVRMVNDLWRTHCQGGGGTGSGPSAPYLVWQLFMPNAVYDINVAPDKRQVQFVNEPALMACIRQNVENLLLSASGEQSFVRADTLDAVTARNSNQQSAHPNTDSAVPAPTPDNDDDLVVPPPTGRFNRRYAFSHSVATARLQNEFDDKRKRRQSFFGFDRILPDDDEGEEETDNGPGGACADDKNTEEQDAVASSLDDDADTDSNPPAKRLAVETLPPQAPVNGSTDPTNLTGSSSSADSLPAAAAQVTPSPMMHSRETVTTTAAEQRLWQQVQQKFNAAGREKEEIVGAVQEQSVVYGDSPQMESTESTDTSDELSSLRRRQFLDQFGAGRRGNQPSATRLEDFGFRVERQSSPPSEAPKSRPKRVSHDSLAPRTSSAPPESHSPSASPDLKETDGKSPSGIQQSPPEVVWKGFESTQAVQQAALTEHLRTRDRKRKLQNEQGQEQATGDDRIVSLRKGDFAGMEIIGQFNMGFIVARTPDNHLYILDQHACDEKYNFEKLCRETIIQEQRLIAPMPIDLSPAEEACILEHTEIFEKNGFRFQYDASKPPRHRFALTGLPHSGAHDGRKAVQFGKDDVSALCSILSGDNIDDGHESMAGGGTGADGSGMYGNNAVRRYAGRGGDSADRVIARLPKAVAMFASRACRTSIMIGKALSHQEMDRVVKKLEKVDQPWNCPHGRPTMRHLGDLTTVMMEDEQRAAEAK